MWAPATRVQHSRVRLRCGSDVTYAEWLVLLPFLPAPCRSSCPRKWEMREIVNVIFYVLRGGIASSLLPKDSPPWLTRYRWFARFHDDGTFAGAFASNLVILAQHRRQLQLARLDDRHLEPAVRGLDLGTGFGAAHRCPARPPHPSRQHPDHERRQLPAAPIRQVAFRDRRTAGAGSDHRDRVGASADRAWGANAAGGPDLDAHDPGSTAGAGAGLNSARALFSYGGFIGQVLC